MNARRTSRYSRRNIALMIGVRTEAVYELTFNLDHPVGTDHGYSSDHWSCNASNISLASLPGLAIFLFVEV